MNASTLLTLILVGAVLASLFTRQRRRSVRPPAAPQRAVAPKPAKPRTKRAQPPAPSRPAAGLSEAQVRAVLQRALGAAREAEQQRLRAQVLEQERKIAERLRDNRRTLDFAELRTLHEKSRQTADLAYSSLDGARSTEQTISENIRNTHRAIEAEQSRGGRGISAMRRTLDALHVDRDVIRTYRERYEQDVQRLNRETGRLRDAIGAKCGPQGRRWHQALMERTRARKEGRRP